MPLCEKLSGPTPATYDTLNRGDVAIFEWSYTLDGDDGEFITFTSGIENGFPGNTDSETVTIKTVQLSNIASQSISTLGFGQTTTVENVFVLHDETFGIPSGANNYQLSSLVPDSSGTTLTFNGASPSYEFFSANVTVTDAHFPAGNWNASLRYYNDHLPSGMHDDADTIWQDDGDGDKGVGMILHFEDVSETSGLYDSQEDPNCYALATNLGSASKVGSIAHSTTMGVNGSGAYFFDGSGQYLVVDVLDHGICNNPHNTGYSLAAWFRSTAIPSWDDEQVVIYLWDDVGAGDMGGYKIELGDGTSDQRGTVFFTNLDEAGGTNGCQSYGDTETGSIDYADGNWHHVVVTMKGSDCNMYIDGTLVDTDGGGSDHLDAGTDDYVYIGANESGAEEFFGYIDDVMMWEAYVLDEVTDGDVTALFEHSFGYNSTNMNFVISNYTDTGVLSDTIVSSNDYGMKWSDQGHYASDNDIFTGGNYTVSLPEVRLNLLDDNNRLGFTMSFASGEPLEFYLDDSALDGAGGNLLSSYLQPTTLVSPQILPAFYTWDQDFPLVEFFVYSSGEEGSWLTYQGTRIVFNGTNGNYSGLVSQIDGVVMTINSDSPFIARNSDIDIDFYPPQTAPTIVPPGEDEKVIPGIYDVTVFLNGYNEDGSIFLRSINLGTITVIE
jgi:hypothetical protein